MLPCLGLFIWIWMSNVTSRIVIKHVWKIHSLPDSLLYFSLVQNKNKISRIFTSCRNYFGFFLPHSFVYKMMINMQNPNVVTVYWWVDIKEGKSDITGKICKSCLPQKTTVHDGEKSVLLPALKNCLSNYSNA